MNRTRTLRRTTACLLVFMSSCLHSLNAQESEEKAWVEQSYVGIAMAVDVIPGLDELYILDPLKEAHGKIRLRSLMYGRPFACIAYDNVTYFGVKDGVDEAGVPRYKVIASVAIPKGIEKAGFMLIPNDILTGSRNGGQHYQVRVMDSSLDAFPLSHTCVVNLLPTQIVLKIGEEKRVVPGGDSILIDEVSSVDKFNMADVSFFYQTKDQWNILKQSKVRYLPSIRYTAVAYFNTRVRKPTIVFVRDGGKVELRTPVQAPASI